MASRAQQPTTREALRLPSGSPSHFAAYSGVPATGDAEAGTGTAAVVGAPLDVQAAAPPSATITAAAATSHSPMFMAREGSRVYEPSGPPGRPSPGGFPGGPGLGLRSVRRDLGPQSGRVQADPQGDRRTTGPGARLELHPGPRAPTRIRHPAPAAVHQSHRALAARPGRSGHVDARHRGAAGQCRGGVPVARQTARHRASRRGRTGPPWCPSLVRGRAKRFFAQLRYDVPQESEACRCSLIHLPGTPCRPQFPARADRRLPPSAKEGALLWL